MKRWLPLLWIPIIAGAGWILADHLGSIEFDDIIGQLWLQPRSTVAGALACSAGIYLLVGVYEGIALRLATGRRRSLLALRTALIANPIGRAVGMAVLSGGTLRYRMYAAAGLSVRQVGTIIVIATLPYLLAVGWMIDLSFLLHARQASLALRLPETVILALAAIGLAKDAGWLMVVGMRQRPLNILGRTIVLPDLRQTLIQIAFGLAQISLMSLLLYLFMPSELSLSWPAFVGIYCIAFVAGQLSSVPAGLGVLEAALLLLLPQVPPAKLLGAVLAYRAIYEFLPLLLALLLWALYELLHPAGIMRKRAIKT